MPANVFLLTAALIETDEFSSFLEKFGGFAHLDRPGNGWIPRGECRVWVSFSPERGPEILADAILEQEEAVTKTLGAPPRSCVNVEMSSTPGSQILAVDFAVAFAEHWPAIVSDIGRHLLDLADLKRLQRKGKGFGLDSAPA
jgi:hypothetical protein